MIAYHESGQALMATEQVPEDRYNMNRSYLSDCLGVIWNDANGHVWTKVSHILVTAILAEYQWLNHYAGKTLAADSPSWVPLLDFSASQVGTYANLDLSFLNTLIN